MTGEKVTIKPFTSSTGYIPWKAIINAYLKSRKLDSVLGEAPPEAATDEIKNAFADKDNATKVIILSSLVKAEVVWVMNKPSAKLMLALLDQFHTKKSAASLATSMTKHRNLRMPEGGDITKFIGEYDQVMAEIRTLKPEDLSDSQAA